jgi:hypothetical protein
MDKKLLNDVSISMIYEEALLQLPIARFTKKGLVCEARVILSVSADGVMYHCNKTIRVVLTKERRVDK